MDPPPSPPKRTHRVVPKQHAQEDAFRFLTEASNQFDGSQQPVPPPPSPRFPHRSNIQTNSKNRSASPSRSPPKSVLRSLNDAQGSQSIASTALLSIPPTQAAVAMSNYASPQIYQPSNSPALRSGNHGVFPQPPAGPPPGFTHSPVHTTVNANHQATPHYQQYVYQHPFSTQPNYWTPQMTHLSNQQQPYQPQPQHPILSTIYHALSPLVLPTAPHAQPRQPFRHKTVKTVQLVHGNYVVDIPVPEKILAMQRGTIKNATPSTAPNGSPTKEPHPPRREWGSADTIVGTSASEDAGSRVSTATSDAGAGARDLDGEEEDEGDVWRTIQGAAAAFFGISATGTPAAVTSDRFDGAALEIQAEGESFAGGHRGGSNVVTPSIVDDSREFTHLRYTAATCDPDEFVGRGYKLRPQELDRKTELLIVITMYNEDDTLFTKTWKAVMRNIAHLCSKRRSPVWGPDGWKKIVVCVVADGREKIHPRTLTVLGVMGCYQEGIIKTSVNNRPTTAHVFEYTTRILVETDRDQSIKGPGAFRMTEAFGGVGLPPIQVLFCLKERNAKKINSHRWFFNAFGRLLKPEVCVLLDVGTKPTDRSIYRLWKAFNKNPHVGGACGEIYVELGMGWSKLWNPLVAAQNFEYKISNILDKPFESCFGFISVLPGAFSAYRYAALQNDEKGVGPLEKYFMGETLHDGGDISKANMYLAEDRILCFELVSKRGAAWVLKYVRSAKAETDVPDTVPEFISQRRRWLNGSFFAGVHALANFHQIVLRSRHTPARKCLFMLQMLYNFVSLIFNWFALGNMYLIFIFLGQSVVSNPATDPFQGYGNIVFQALSSIYLWAIILVFLSSLGNRPQGSKALYIGCFFLFALVMAGLLYITGYSLVHAFPKTIDDWNTAMSSVVQAPIIFNTLLSMGSTYGVYFIASFMFLDPWHMITSMLQYLLLMPSFINILMVYAFCNIHDVSWGTKGDNKAPSDHGAVVAVKGPEGKDYFFAELPNDQSDINALYERLLQDLGNRSQPERFAWWKRARKDPNREDFFKLFRTRIVLFWISSNAVLVMVMTTPMIANLLGISENDPNNPYVTVILWSVAVLSIVRFVGSCLYLMIP